MLPIIRISFGVRRGVSDKVAARDKHVYYSRGNCGEGNDALGRGAVRFRIVPRESSFEGECLAPHDLAHRTGIVLDDNSSCGCVCPMACRVGAIIVDEVSARNCYVDDMAANLDLVINLTVSQALTCGVCVVILAMPSVGVNNDAHAKWVEHGFVRMLVHYSPNF
jgi:hypothetical protein